MGKYKDAKKDLFLTDLKAGVLFCFFSGKYHGFVTWISGFNIKLIQVGTIFCVASEARIDFLHQFAKIQQAMAADQPGLVLQDHTLQRLFCCLLA